MSNKLLNIIHPGAVQPQLLQNDELPPNILQSGTLQPNKVHFGIMQPNALKLNTLQPNSFSTCYSCIMKVTGEGVVKAEPDSASVVLGVVTESMQLENAQNENTRKMSEVIDSLVKNGIAEKDIKTQSFQVQPQYDYVNGEQVFRGYRVVHEVRAKISNINMVGSVIDEAVRAGANTVSDIGFHVSNPQMFYEMAINKALSDAVSKAASVGSKMNVYVNPIPFRITEMTTPISPPTPYISMQATGATTPIQPGMNEITALLEAEFVYSCSRSY